MLDKFRKLVGLQNKSHIFPAALSVLPAPYKDPANNLIYNLLFCDDPSLFKSGEGASPTAWEQLLFVAPDAHQIRALADDAHAESRVRALAFNWLRRSGHDVPKGTVLGVILEVPLAQGLDTLAVYADGRIRYLNQSGKMVIIEAPTTQTAPLAKALLDSAQAPVNRFGPWDKARLPAPDNGNIRMTFLVSDGLYFGQGPFALMQKDPMSAPVIAIASQLLQVVVNASLG